MAPEAMDTLKALVVAGSGSSFAAGSAKVEWGQRCVNGRIAEIDRRVAVKSAS